MEYFAGLFDAEGYVTLTNQGNYLIGMEMTNETVINLLKNTFGGVVDKRKRDDRRNTWAWRLSAKEIQNFIDQIKPYSIIKLPQIEALQTYLDQPREERRKNRSNFVSLISNFKKPEIPRSPLNQIYPEISEPFFKWLAGMMDGDGNFCIYETLNKGKWTQFQSYVGVFNVFIEPIQFIKDHLGGTVTSLKKTKNPIWKWIPNQKNIPFICESVLPYLIIKKELCKIVLSYHKMKKSNRFIQYTDSEKGFIRDSIRQIKHHNTL